MICPNCSYNAKGSICDVCQTVIKEEVKKKKGIKKIKLVGDKTHLKKLEDDLWDIFSIFIRKRDALKFSGGEVGKCITCSHVAHYKEMQAGHFISRKEKATKFEEKNNNMQCGGCNGIKSGMQYEHGLAIDRMYGQGTATKLLIQSKNTVKWGVFEFEMLIKLYKQKIKQL